MGPKLFAGRRPDKHSMGRLTSRCRDRVMTTKDKAISVIHTLDDNATLHEMIDRLHLLRKIELGIAQVDAGEVAEHDEFMAELEREDV